MTRTRIPRVLASTALLGALALSGAASRASAPTASLAAAAEAERPLVTF